MNCQKCGRELETIVLTKRQVTVVASEDFEKVNQYRWFAFKPRKVWYVYGGRTKLYMHRVLTNAQKGQEVDHIDGNGLNNCKCNLRIGNDGDIVRNRGLQKNNTSGYTGVVLCKKNNTYIAQFQFNGKVKNLGYYKTAEEAAFVASEARKSHFKEFAPDTSRPDYGTRK